MTEEEKQMKKRSIAARLGVFALALTLITTSLSSGTFAKYTNTFDGKFNVLVATWNVSAAVNYTGSDGDKVLQGNNHARIDELAKTASTKPVGVKDGYLAPGMSGSFNVLISNYDSTGALDTKVTVHYKVSIQASNAVFPDSFTFNGEAVSDSDPHVVAEGYIAPGTMAKLTAAGGGAIEVPINWNWAWDQDSNDMAVVEGFNDLSTSTSTAEHFLVKVELTQDLTHDTTSKVDLSD